jgi:hypothetical protein
MPCPCLFPPRRGQCTGSDVADCMKLILLVTLVVAALGACRDATGAPETVAGTFALVGCTNGSTGAPTMQDCGSGGSVRHSWSSGRFELRVDGSAVRALSATTVANVGTPSQTTTTGTDSTAGMWTVSGDTVTIVWDDAFHPIPSKVVLFGRDSLRDNSVFNQFVVFWFVRR